ncbi:hypothetical protein GCM10023162_38560 [Klenkia terrae]
MTTALWVDLALVLLLAGGAVAGWRRGGLRLAGSVVGLVVGLAVGAAVVPVLTGSLQGTTRWVVTLVGILVAAALGSGLGRAAGGLVAAVVARLHLSVLDRAAGAVGGLLLTFVGLGLVLSMLTLDPGAGGQWRATARSSQLGALASGAADQAWQVVGGHTAGLDLSIPGGPR